MKQKSSKHELRRAAEAQIEMLISLLDSLDGDPDMEPSLAGYSEGMDDREGDPADDEPSLCGITVSPGCELDLEHSCDDEGDNSDSGIGDSDGLMEQIVAVENGSRPQLLAGFGTSGFARHVE